MGANLVRQRPGGPEIGAPGFFDYMIAKVIDLKLIPVLVETTKNSKPTRYTNHDYQERERTLQLVPTAGLPGRSCVLVPFPSEKLRIFCVLLKTNHNDE